MRAILEILGGTVAAVFAAFVGLQMWFRFMDWLGNRRCQRQHAEHHESRQLFYDGTRIVWCGKCRQAWWRK